MSSRDRMPLSATAVTPRGIEAARASRTPGSPSRAHPPPRGGELPQRRWVERADDEQRGVSAMHGSFEELVLGDDEVFPEQRQIDGVTDGAQMIDRAVAERRP